MVDMAPSVSAVQAEDEHGAGLDSKPKVPAKAASVGLVFSRHVIRPHASCRPARRCLC